MPLLYDSSGPSTYKVFLSVSVKFEQSGYLKTWPFLAKK